MVGQWRDIFSQENTWHPRNIYYFPKSRIYESLWHYDPFLYVGGGGGNGKECFWQKWPLFDNTVCMILNKLLQMPALFPHLLKE